MTEILEATELETLHENPLRALVQDRPLVYPSRMNSEAFDRFVLENGDFKIERDKFGTITIHPPMTLQSGHDEGEAFFYLKFFAKTHKHLGKAFSPSTAFILPDGSQNKADGAWLSAATLSMLSEEEFGRIARVVPDFLIEVRSKTDSLRELKKKMEEVWMENGVQLAWLIDPLKEKAWVYRQNLPTEEIENFRHILNGEPVLPGFQLDLRDLKNGTPTLSS